MDEVGSAEQGQDRHDAAKKGNWVFGGDFIYLERKQYKYTGSER